MRAMPIVTVEPERQVGGALLRGFVGLGICPFAQCGLDEAFGLTICLRRIGFGADVFDAEPPQRLGVSMGTEACAVVGHDALDLDLKKRMALKRKRRQERRVSLGNISK